MVVGILGTRGGCDSNVRTSGTLTLRLGARDSRL